jgi:hypothetical protein
MNFYPDLFLSETFPNGTDISQLHVYNRPYEDILKNKVYGSSSRVPALPA